MNIERFGVEEWMDKYESDAKYNITDTCARPMTLKELFALAGEDREDFVEALFEKEQSYGSIYGLASLKEEIAGLYETITPDDILTQHGATGGNQHVLFSLVRPGDRGRRFFPELPAVLLDAPRSWSQCHGAEAPTKQWIPSRS